MSPKLQAQIRLYLIIAVTAIPGLATAWSSAGYARVGAGLSLLGLSLACVWHAYQTAIGDLPATPGGGTAAKTGPSAKQPPASAFRPIFAFGILVFLLACGATSPAILAADNVAIDLTDTVCAPLENQPAGQPYVDFLCTLVEGAEDIIASVETTPDAGLTAAPAVKSVRIRVPAGEALSFMAAHRKVAKVAK